MKFSKSRNIGVFGDVKDTGIPVSVWRYYLISSRPDTSDSIFTWKEFITGIILNCWPILKVNHVMKFVAAKYDGTLPSFSCDSESEQTLIKNINNLLANYIEALENIKLHAGLEIAMEIHDRAMVICRNQNSITLCLPTVLRNAIRPYMPSVTEPIVHQLNASLRNIPDTFIMDIEAGHQIDKAEYLFKRIDEKIAEEFSKKFAGESRDDKKKQQKKRLRLLIM
ncbi:8316_t:CDS:2 [Cetraspora pellucida]|uniref:8316_t:CDS:1 n=2 Tax=Cetraspora pellucida TaxID=1433469 RepID=A0ACA9KC68_9GLOM|nr:8315_t:CDS:2 [Cetraspora pellucida]CAG8465232.1 8316_t:CDS:2 [Cetraspora pellucida]